MPDLLFELRMQVDIGRQDRAGLQHIPAVEFADHAARFADQHDTGSDIPGLQVPLPEAVKPAGSDPGKVQRGRPVAADPGGGRRHRGNFAGESDVALFGLAMPRRAGGDDRFIQVPAGRHAQLAIVQPGAAAGLGPENLVLGDIEAKARKGILVGIAICFKKKMKKKGPGKKPKNSLESS